MLKRLSIKKKLLAIIGLALITILGLAASSNLVLMKTTKVSQTVKEKTFNVAILMEKVAALGQTMINQIDRSASEGTDTGLIEAKEVLALMDEQFKEAEGFLQNKAIKEKLVQLAQMTKGIYALGEERVGAVIDQDFAVIPEATKAFQEKSVTCFGMISELRNLARKGLEAALESIQASSKTGVMISIIVSVFGIFALLALCSFVFRAITSPIGRAVDMIRDVAEGEGDLTKRLEINAKDEIGELAEWFNVFIGNLQGIMKDVRKNASRLDQSSSALSGISQHMSSGAQEVSEKSNAVANAAEEMSSTMSSVAAATEQASTNASMVATASEEMTATINEIAQNSEKARGISGEAVSDAQETSDKVSELGRAAQEIGKVTETINEISEQTNLLALNATIEAARAGEAGKGFAVVANEIKELARQTAVATGEIRSRIESIQNSTGGTVTQIEKITKVINDVNEIVTTIATAVEEQSVTTKEIASNVAYASQGMQEVTTNVTQCSGVTNEIASDISEMNHAAGEMANSSSQVNINAGELSESADQLEKMVQKFKV